MEKHLLFIVILVLCISYGFSQNSNIANAVAEVNPKYTKVERGVLGTYANPLRFANGQIDQNRLIAELRDIHANTYNWLVRTNTDDLEALKHFLPLARKAGLRVWSTVLPPSEPPYSEPFQLDYVRWATELATLSLSDPNLVAWSIDDFAHNLKIYTPDYVKRILSDAFAINPKLAFVPCYYFRQITTSFVKDYAPLLGGILFPYRAGSVGANLKDATQVENEIAKIRDMVGNDLPIIMDIYASPHSSLGASTSQYVQDVLDSGLKYADGVIIYCNQDPEKDLEKYEIIKKEFGHAFKEK